jgi:undecaprenyl diphosphate synthase
MCVNYGSRIEITDAINAITQDVVAGKLKAGTVTEKTVARYLNSSYLPDVDLFLRSSGEQRVSNFLLWQSAYAEFVFLDTPWPDFNRSHLWQAIEQFGSRSRRFGGAVDAPSVANQLSAN